MDTVAYAVRDGLDLEIQTLEKKESEIREIFLFFYDCKSKTAIHIRKMQIEKGHIRWRADNTSLLQMKYMDFASVRIAIAVRFERNGFCGWLRNKEARREETAPEDRIIGKVYAKNGAALAAYWTDGGILTLRRKNETKFDGELLRTRLVGSRWDGNRLALYLETPLFYGTPKMTLHSMSTKKVCDGAEISLKESGFTGLRRVFRGEIDLSEALGEADSYCLIVELDGHCFPVFADETAVEKETVRTISSKTAEQMDVMAAREADGLFVLQLAEKIYPVMLSIVTAVYNTAPFLAEMINSVLTQDTSRLNSYVIGNPATDYTKRIYQNIYEFILVDDGSTDGSAEILDDYARMSDLIRVIHKENGGVFSARNAGIDVARGKYITFLSRMEEFEKINIEKIIVDIKSGNSLHMEGEKVIYKKERLFSIIMSVYNVDLYIEEAIDSLLNQDIGFEENVHLILVNDGSTDTSGEICEAYAEKYPDNITYVWKENGGLSSARNVGLEYVDGKYVNFFDPDDTLSLNVLSETARFFEANYNIIDMVCIPLVYFEGKTGLHDKYGSFGERNRIISLVREPHNFILSAASSFYKSEVFKNLRFDERMMTGEDTKVNLQIIRRTLSFGYVCEKGVQYNYRKRIAGTSNVDAIRSGSNFEALMSPVYIFEDLFNQNGYLAPYEKELLAYELRSRLRNAKREAFAEEKYQRLLALYSKWIGKLDDEFIAKSKWLDNIEKKVLFLNLSGRSFGEWVRSGFSEMSDRIIRIRQMYFENGKAHIVCTFNNFNEADIDLFLLSQNAMTDNLTAAESMDLETPYDLEIGDFMVDITHVRHFEVPIRNAEYVFAYYDRKTKRISRVRRCAIYGKARCAANILGVGPVRNGFCISVYGSNILISNDKKVVSNITNTLQNNAKKQLPLRRLSLSEKRYILIFDRPEKAEDNGEALFEYIMEHEDDSVRDVTFFVINKKSRAYQALKHKDHVVDFRSRTHLEMFLNAKVIYSSHNAIRFFYPFDESEYKNYADLLDYKFVWLQHGVTKDDIVKEANKLNTLDDVVVTCSNWEYQNFLKPGYLYKHNDILLSGFARFDKLIDEKKKIITVAPTWRKNLVGRILPNGHNEAKDGFENSLFYQSYIRLLTDRRLLDKLEEYDYRLDFVLHSGFTCYEKFFHAVNSERIRVVPMDDFSYRRAFCESSLFITDYSSTAFDFAYLKKPVIYFQFDEEDFFTLHYSKSTYEYRTDGFGPILNNVEDVINQIISQMKKGCEMPEPYRERVDRTFAYFDRNNCRRIVDATRKWFI